MRVLRTLPTVRTVRIIISSISFVVVTALFLDIKNCIPPSWNSTLLVLQFGPAMIKTISSFGIAFFGLFFVSVLTVLFGRVYCSHLCPLGTLQDIIIWFGKKKYKHRIFPFQKTNYIFHYSFTAAIILLAIGGNAILLNLFEPFSNYGRMLSSLVRPPIIFVNNIFAMLIKSTNMFGVAEITLHGLNLWNVAFPLFFLIMIIGLTVWRGRLFCNLFCPVGGILSLISRFSLFKITIQNHGCIDCGLCERVCRAQCIDSEKKTVDFAACVGCFDCIGSCPTDGMGYTFQRRSLSTTTHKEDSDRRIVLLSLSTLLIDSTGLRTIAGATLPVPSGYGDAKTKPTVPPGGRSQEFFESYCTACHLCISSCPTHVLQPSFLEYGFAGILQPRMDYNVSYCNYDCTICGEVCPTGAIQKLVQQEKKLVQLGKVTFVKEDCIVEIKKKDCGACSEHCPTKAVKMVLYEGKLFLPQIENDYCIGCGACEHACPTTPRKAIYVTPNSVHQTAKKREEKRLEPQEATPQEFPF